VALSSAWLVALQIVRILHFWSKGLFEIGSSGVFFKIAESKHFVLSPPRSTLLFRHINFITMRDQINRILVTPLLAPLLFMHAELLAPLQKSGKMFVFMAEVEMVVRRRDWRTDVARLWFYMSRLIGRFVKIIIDVIVNDCDAVSWLERKCTVFRGVRQPRSRKEGIVLNKVIRSCEARLRG
jgi:hypothetical protein